VKIFDADDAVVGYEFYKLLELYVYWATVEAIRRK
jgi:hypothetical protein